jgi:hypothetical protein
MKRDMELVRLVLIELETGEPPPELSNYPQRQVFYHYKLLADAGLIVAGFVDDDDDIPISVGWARMTWAGHDFLAATNNSKLWAFTRDHILKPGVSWTFQALLSFLQQESIRAFPTPPPGL